MKRNCRFNPVHGFPSEAFRMLSSLMECGRPDYQSMTSTLSGISPRGLFCTYSRASRFPFANKGPRKIEKLKLASAFVSLRAFPALKMKGTPSHRRFLTNSTHVAKVGVFESSGTPASGRPKHSKPGRTEQICRKGRKRSSREEHNRLMELGYVRSGLSCCRQVNE